MSKKVGFRYLGPRGTSQAHIVKHLVRIQYYVLSGHNKFKKAAKDPEFSVTKVYCTMYMYM
jgi:hypothetical protein